MKILFCNTGWMNYYDYEPASSDVIQGGGSYIQDHGIGGEVFNFSEFNGKYYGYVRSSISGRTEINRLGANKEDAYVDDILVIWIASHPTQGKVRIVGWYKNARVYRDTIESPKGSKRNDIDFGYNIEAFIENCYLVPKDERTLIIDKATKTTGGIGRSNIFYCDGRKNEQIKFKALNFIESYELKSKSNNRTRVKVDIERNKRVETNAVNAAFNYYERHGYRVISVEKDNCGWDLEAVMSNERLLVEVKGVSSSNVEVSLTPNEYKNMKSHVDKYRLFILTNALKENECKEFIFSYDSDSGEWRDYEKKHVVL